MEPRSSSIQRSLLTYDCNIACCTKISIIFVVVALLFILHQMHSNGNSFAAPELPHYTVVLDCGSTGSRINVYEWLRRTTKKKDELMLLKTFPDYSSGNHLLRHSCEYHCMQSEPGLDKFAYNFSGLSSALEPLLIWAERNIPLDRHRYTPVFVLGTAGLRKLSVDDSDWIMANVEAVVRKHQFIYKKRWIRVLSGEEEGYYAWIALNYKLGRLDRSKNDTLGILDLGGSSMQVAMETEKPIENQHYFQSKIGSVEHGLLTYSLEGFGLNDAFDRSIMIVGKDPLARKWRNGRYQLLHPCLNKGFMKNYTCLTCSKQWMELYPQNATKDLSIGQPQLFYLLGYPHWSKCKALARAASVRNNSTDFFQLSRNMYCNHPNSVSRGTPDVAEFTSNHRNHAIRFHALSGFSIVYSSTTNQSKTNLADFLDMGQKLCSRSWEIVDRDSGKQRYAEQSCFRIPYIVSLLKDALCLNDANISFGPSDVSWTLGAALIEGELLSLTLNKGLMEELISKHMKVVSFFLFLLAVVLCSYSLVFCRKFKRVIMPFLPSRKAGQTELPLSSFFFSKGQVH